MFESTVVCGRIALGIQGEHNARKVSFYDAEIWKERFGEGRFELLHQRNGDEAPYPVVLTVEDGVPYWYVSSADTAISGSGKCELRYLVDETVIKSCTFITDVTPSLVEGADVPEPEKTWVDQVLEAGETAKQAVEYSEKAIEASESAEQSAKDAQQSAMDAEAFAAEGNAHINDTSNPHEVTAEHVGAYTKEEVEGRFVNWHEQLLHKIYHNEINTTRTLRTDIVYLYKAESLEGVVYDDVPFRTATIFNSQPFSVSLGLPTIVQTAIANDGQVYVRELSNKVNIEDEYDFSIPWVCKTYTKSEVDNKIGSIDTALDELHAYATSLIGGEA